MANLTELYLVSYMHRSRNAYYYHILCVASFRINLSLSFDSSMDEECSLSDAMVWFERVEI